MGNVTIEQIVGAIGLITVILGFIATIHNFVKKTTLDKIAQNTKDIEELQKEVGVLKSEVDDSKEERLILLQGLLACLKGLHEQGCNDSVTSMIAEIENYLIKKSHI